MLGITPHASLPNQCSIYPSKHITAGCMKFDNGVGSPDDVRGEATGQPDLIESVDCPLCTLGPGLIHKESVFDAERRQRRLTNLPH